MISFNCSVGRSMLDSRVGQVFLLLCTLECILVRSEKTRVRLEGEFRMRTKAMCIWFVI